MLSPELKKEWVAALRSGNYQQARDWLIITGDQPKHCCLGVLATIANEPLYAIAEYTPIRLSTDDAYTIQGLSRTVGIKLAEMNDSDKWDFNQIADWIENNPEI